MGYLDLIESNKRLCLVKTCTRHGKFYRCNNVFFFVCEYHKYGLSIESSEDEYIVNEIMDE